MRRSPAAELLAGLGVLVHGVFAWGHLHGQVSVLDEGLYLYKGWLFATGRFTPFEDFGPYTNHMPLSFLIPGWVQVIFGPGLRTGRLMAFALGLLLLIGLWLVAKRFAGRWWALVPVWFVALNPFLTKIYAQAISQVLVAAMLVWVLVLTLGRDRPPWQWILGSALAGLVAMTRINLLPLPILLILYLAWVHGIRRAAYGLMAAAGVILLGHLVLWPDILKLWAYWIPRAPTPFLDAWREPADIVLRWNPQYELGTRPAVFLTGLRRHLAAILGVLAAILTWPRLSGRDQGSGSSKAVVFLVGLFVLLLGEHAWAALGNDYCVYCFPLYLAFFSPIGLLVLAMVVGNWLPRLPATHSLGLVLLGLLLALLLGVDSIEKAAKVLASTQVPRIANFRLLPGTASLAQPLEAKLGLATTTLHLLFELGFLLWIMSLLLLLIYAAFRILRAWRGREFPHGLTSVLALWLGLWILPHGIVMGNRFRTYDCGGDVLTAVEQAGARINEALEPGSTVYWKGSLSPGPLLYAPDIIVYPPQLNRVYSYRLNGSPERLNQLGLWNPQLDAKWLAEADYLLVSEEYHDVRTQEAVVKLDYKWRTSTHPTNPCRPESSIHIFRRIQ